MAVRIVLFDFGNVIASWDPAPRMAEYARRTELTPDEVRRRLERDDFAADSDRGRYPVEQIVRHIGEVLGYAFSHTELLRLQACVFALRPDVLSLARAVATIHRVGVLTNNSPLFGECLAPYFPEIVDVFDPILLSSQLGYVKPEREAFEAVERRIGASGGEIAFIDDGPENVAAARSLGWVSFHYTSTRALERQLSEAGLLPLRA